jgi:hypothetical protein
MEGTGLTPRRDDADRLDPAGISRKTSRQAAFAGRANRRVPGLLARPAAAGSTGSLLPLFAEPSPQIGPATRFSPNLNQTV